MQLDMDKIEDIGEVTLLAIIRFLITMNSDTPLRFLNQSIRSVYRWMRLANISLAKVESTAGDLGTRHIAFNLLRIPVFCTEARYPK